MPKRHTAVSSDIVLAKLEEMQHILARLVGDFRKEVARELQERNIASATRIATEWVKDEKEGKSDPDDNGTPPDIL